MMSLTEQQVFAKLKECYDPELPCNLVDLGLVYSVKFTPIPVSGLTPLAVSDTCCGRDDDVDHAGLSDGRPHSRSGATQTARIARRRRGEREIGVRPAVGPFPNHARRPQGAEYGVVTATGPRFSRETFFIAARARGR